MDPSPRIRPHSQLMVWGRHITSSTRLSTSSMPLAFVASRAPSHPRDTAISPKALNRLLIGLPQGETRIFMSTRRAPTPWRMRPMPQSGRNAPSSGCVKVGGLYVAPRITIVGPRSTRYPSTIQNRVIAGEQLAKTHRKRTNRDHRTCWAQRIGTAKPKKPAAAAHLGSTHPCGYHRM